MKPFAKVAGGAIIVTTGIWSTVPAKAGTHSPEQTKTHAPTALTVVRLGGVFDKDATITADVVVLPAGGSVKIQDGKVFTVIAKQLRIEGPFTFDGRGAPGASGSTPPPWTSSGPTPFHFGPIGKDVAHDDWERAGGSPNDVGGAGAAGGNGAIIRIRYGSLVETGSATTIADIRFLVQGGAGGAGGAGRLLICGSNSAHTKRGPAGRPGARGTDGSWSLDFLPAISSSR